MDHSKQIQPVFLLSLPRSGSTLLQRILAAHPDISTTAEPWLLLPLFYSLRDQGICAEYWQRAAAAALDDYCRHLPSGKKDYFSALREFALTLYSRAADNGTRYFVDKTPRYHLILPELLETFPDAKLIFLWRNPLSVIASIMNTFAEGTWNLHRYKIDLYRGLENLMETYRACQNSVLSVNYESLIQHPDREISRIMRYMEIDEDVTIKDSFKDVGLTGYMGDPTGPQEYQSISEVPLTKWKGTLRNPLRKAWCKHYLDHFEEADWELIGYDRDEMKKELAELPPTARGIFSDASRILYGLLLPFACPQNFKPQFKALRELKNLHPWY